MFLSVCCVFKCCCVFECLMVLVVCLSVCCVFVFVCVSVSTADGQAVCSARIESISSPWRKEEKCVLLRRDVNSFQINLLQVLNTPHNP